APGTVAALAFGAEGRRLAIGAWDRRRDHSEVAIWDLAIGRVIRTIDAGPRPIRAVAFSADGRRVAAGGGGARATGSGVRGGLGRPDRDLPGHPRPRGTHPGASLRPGRAPVRRRGVHRADLAPLGPRDRDGGTTARTVRGELPGVYARRPAAGVSGLRRSGASGRRTDRGGASGPSQRRRA